MGSELVQQGVRHGEEAGFAIAEVQTNLDFAIGIHAGFLEQLALACKIDHAAVSHRHGFNLGFGLAHFEAP